MLSFCHFSSWLDYKLETVVYIGQFFLVLRYHDGLFDPPDAKLTRQLLQGPLLRRQPSSLTAVHKFANFHFNLSVGNCSESPVFRTVSIVGNKFAEKVLTRKNASDFCFRSSRSSRRVAHSLTHSLGRRRLTLKLDQDCFKSTLTVDDRSFFRQAAAAMPGRAPSAAHRANLPAWKRRDFPTSNAMGQYGLRPLAICATVAAAASACDVVWT